MTLNLKYILLGVLSLASNFLYSQAFEEFWRLQLRKLDLHEGDTVITYKYPPFINFPPPDSVKGLGEIRYHNLAYIIVKNKSNITITKLIDYFYIIQSDNKIRKSRVHIIEDNTVFSFLSANYKTITAYGDQMLPYISRVERDSTVAYFPVHSSHPIVITIGLIMKDQSFDFEVDTESIVPGFGMLDRNLNYNYNIQKKSYQLYCRIKQLIESIDNRFIF